MGFDISVKVQERILYLLKVSEEGKILYNKFKRGQLKAELAKTLQ